MTHFDTCNDIVLSIKRVINKQLKQDASMHRFIICGGGPREARRNYNFDISIRTTDGRTKKEGNRECLL
jgi:hypothetical protein